MVRKKFLADVQQAGLSPPNHITDVKQYEADGIRFTFSWSTDFLRTDTCLTLISTSVDEYPSGNGFILFTEDSDVDPTVQSMLEELQLAIDNLTVQDALTQISDTLFRRLSFTQSNSSATLDSESIPASPEYHSANESMQDASFDDEDFDEFDHDPDDNFGFDEPKTYGFQTLHRADYVRNEDNTTIRFKRDISSTRKAGFRVGIYGNPESTFIICISVRLARLGISEDAMQSWGLFRHQYLVLLIRFIHGYQSITEVRKLKNLSGDVEIRVGICDSYKPSSEEAFGHFDNADTTDSKRPVDQQQQIKDSKKMKPLFIGRPLNELFRNQFAQIVGFRNWGMSWAGAEQCYKEMRGNMPDAVPVDKFGLKHMPHDNNHRVLPKIAVSDALAEMGNTAAPLPLVAMQFLLRHFVRCSEFCLVCHCKIPNAVEAIKPYVCTSSLCLYQFLALGFGPSVEWEIMAQPQVVDLLISLCYAQVFFQRLKDLPLGIGLKTPFLKDKVTLTLQPIGRGGVPHPPNAIPKNEVLPSASESCFGKLDISDRTINIEGFTWPSSAQLHGGEWLALVSQTLEGVHHCRVRNFTDTTIILNELVGPNSWYQTAYTANTNSIHDVQCYLYEVNFDELPVRYQYSAILTMLDSLPPVAQMQKQLEKQRDASREASLSSLSMIPPPARDLLRWVVASNRSCIMQVDKVSDNAGQQHIQASEPRVGGMNEWMQFRFAQGAPDKEVRFIESIKQYAMSKTYPTIFAWHGSPLYNWHSIIRSGLNFDEVIHGRASGNGVYMSPHLQTSMGYTGGGTASSWSGSELKISTVVSLQEVINAPTQFVSTRPHLVVSHKDWIQTRYLFVKTTAKHSSTGPPSLQFEQDPHFKLSGATQEAITIPINAISKSRDPQQTSKPAEYDFDSDNSDAGDLEWFEDGTLNSGNDEDCILVGVRKLSPILGALSPRSRKRKSAELSYILDQFKTDFVPGLLDTSNIKFLPPPTDATPAATRTLMKAVSEIRKLQEMTPLHELGFYIDPDRIENVYQWIVEMHSFDPDLPLAQDLKAAGLTSIVLEILFTNDHPYSPPFVRVVKPRFLPFLQGGGGHVTEGGAICMELLTSNGWSVVCTMENVLLQIRLAMSETDRPARLQSRSPHTQNVCYDVKQALSAYRRACQKHGWKESRSVAILMNTI